jgi:putative Holliday junction resolvase
MARLMGLDYGDKTIGVAVSDVLGITAQSVETIRRDGPNVFKPVMRRIGELASEYGIGGFVLGYPKGMDGGAGSRGPVTLDFKSRLEKTFNLTVTLWDERLSTVAVERAMLGADLRRNKRKDAVDRQAAAYILQGYLDFTANQNKQREKVNALNEDISDNGFDEGLEDTDGVDVIIIPDENGVEKEYVIIDVIDHKGATYLLAVEMNSAEDDEADAVLLKQVGEDEENYTYEEPTDAEFEEIAKILSERSDEYEIEI